MVAADETELVLHIGDISYSVGYVRAAPPARVGSCVRARAHVSVVIVIACVCVCGLRARERYCG